MTPRANAVADVARRVIDNVEKVLVGKRSTIELVVVALVSGGHVLLEDVPGTGKTMLARATASSLGIDFRRIQCTPDLLPTEITGVNVFDQAQGNFQFQPGPVFANIVLADEVNRATPRTQAALLEAMQERQVTVEGITRPLPRPFLVLATQNPIEFEGTFPLPEAQLDRFLLRLSVGYPDGEEELRMLRSLRGSHPIDAIGPAIEPGELDAIRTDLTDIHVDESLERYMLDIVQTTRTHPDLSLGASPRGSLALHRSARALAAVRGRDYVVPDDVKELAPAVLTHRLTVAPDSQVRGRRPDSVMDDVLERCELTLERTGS